MSSTDRSHRRQPGRVLGHLFEPVDIASLVVFRMVFGCVMLWHVWKYFQIGAIDADYIRPPFHFTWYWFDWVRPLPGPGMYLFFYTMGLLALGVLLGLHYRVCAFLLSIAFTYQFLLDQAYYLNHYYLTCLLALLMAFVPAHHAFSLDATAVAVHGGTLRRRIHCRRGELNVSGDVACVVFVSCSLS